MTAGKEFELPPPSLPLPPGCPTGRSESRPSFSAFLHHQQAKLVKLNQKRATRIKQVPAVDDMIDLRKLGFSGSQLEAKIFSVLQKLLSWKAPVKVERLSAAMTNCIFLVNRKVLIRVYGDGTDNLFDREREITIFQILSSTSVGPNLLGKFKNGRVEEFLDSRTLTPSEVYHPSISRQIATALFQVHGLVGVVPQKQAISEKAPSRVTFETEFWSRMLDWYIKAINSMNILLLQCNSGNDELHRRLKALKIEQLKDDILALQKNAAHYPVVFAHNDLQYGNILQLKDKSLCIIDYEYACYNYRGFDFANHFCEWAAG
jgi:thiamine kinase-like enzyme